MPRRRRPNGTGSVTKFRSKFRAKVMINKAVVYGTPRATWAEAEADLPSLISPLSFSEGEGAGGEGPVPTLASWAYSQSIGSYGQGLAPNTQETNETYRLRFLHGQALGALRLDQITPAILRDFFTPLQAERRRKVGAKIEVTLVPASPRYKHRIKGYFSKLFSLAIEAGHIAVNPCLSVKLPTVIERENTHATLEQIAKLAQGSSRIDGIALLCALCGLRPAEARLVTWAQIDRENAQIVQPGTKNATAKKPVPLPDQVLRVLDLQPCRAAQVFTTHTGRPITKDRMQADWIKRREELNLPATLRLQDLRGTYVSLLIQSGVDVRTTMELARHATPSVTLKAYARVQDSHRRAAQAKITDAVSAAIESQLGHTTRAQETA